eukprot:TRINITY_DN41_c0_g3_i1.p1 TRINITY_DN41_c0_g3~~TRINITY_DN41_c0_g3_i1.p1  ORF type:complete len:1230 (-),score=445.76 TRINITY_DN41_c0_g3_i1:220-3909(-)
MFKNIVKSQVLNVKAKQSWKSINTGGKVDISKDGTLSASLCDGDVVIYNLTDNTEKIRLQDGVHETKFETITAFALHPNGHEIITSSENLLIRQWDVESGNCIKFWKGHEGVVLAMAYDPSGTHIATGSIDRSIKVWEVKGGFCTHNFTGHSQIITSLKFHQNLVLFSMSQDCQIGVWSLYQRKAIGMITDHTSIVTGVDFDETGGVMVSVARDQICNVWTYHQEDRQSADVTFKKQKSFSLNEDAESVTVLPRSLGMSLLETYKQEGTFKYEIPRSKQVQSRFVFFVTVGAANTIKFWCYMPSSASNPNPRCLMVASQAIKVPSTVSLLQSTFLSHSSKLILTTSDQNVLFFSVDPVSVDGMSSGFIFESQIVGFNDNIYDIKYVPTIGNPPDDKPTVMAIATNSEQIRLYDSATGFCSLLSGHADLVTDIDISPCGRFLLSASKDNTARLWKFQYNSDNGKAYNAICVGVFAGHQDSLSTCCFSKKRHGFESNEGQPFCVTAGEDRTLKLWKIRDFVQGGKENLTVKASATVVAHQKDVNCVTVAPNDRVVATGSQDKTIKLYKIVPGKLPRLDLMGEMKGHKRGIWSLEFSSVDQSILSCSSDTTIRIWSVINQNCLKTFKGHDSAVMKAAFMRGCTQIASVSSAGLMKLWSVKDTECVRTIEAHTGRIWALALRNDIRKTSTDMEGEIATGGADSIVTQWTDCTKQEQEEEIQSKEERIAMEQRIRGLLAGKQYFEAVRCAIELDYPLKCRTIIQNLLEQNNPLVPVYSMPETEDPATAIAEAKASVETIIMKLELPLQMRLFGYCKQWNTSQKTVQVAWACTRTLLKVLPILMQKLRAKAEDAESEEEERKEYRDFCKEVYKTVIAMLPYSERQMKRAGALAEQLYLVDYTAASFTIAPQTDLPTSYEDVSDSSDSEEEEDMMMSENEDADDESDAEMDRPSSKYFLNNASDDDEESELSEFEDGVAPQIDSDSSDSSDDEPLPTYKESSSEDEWVSEDSEISDEEKPVEESKNEETQPEQKQTEEQQQEQQQEEQQEQEQEENPLTSLEDEIEEEEKPKEEEKKKEEATYFSPIKTRARRKSLSQSIAPIATIPEPKPVKKSIPAKAVDTPRRSRRRAALKVLDGSLAENAAITSSGLPPPTPAKRAMLPPKTTRKRRRTTTLEEDAIEEAPVAATPKRRMTRTRAATTAKKTTRNASMTKNDAVAMPTPAKKLRRSSRLAKK